MEIKTSPVVCFVGNFKYLYKHFPRIYQQLRINGNYKNEVVVITSLTCPSFLIKYLNRKNNVTLLRFKKIKFDKTFQVILKLFVKFYILTLKLSKMIQF